MPDGRGDEQANAMPSRPLTRRLAMGVAVVALLGAGLATIRRLFRQSRPTVIERPARDERSVE